jgi:DNA-binding transcriptional regulator YiaG
MEYHIHSFFSERGWPVKKLNPVFTTNTLKMDYQDWNPVTIRNSARLAEKKALTQPKRSNEAQHQAKIDREEIGKMKMLSPESRQELVQRRLAEKLTQQQLDQRCSFPTHTIRDLEANKRAPTMKELQVLNRVLKCGLKLV